VKSSSDLEHSIPVVKEQRRLLSDLLRSKHARETTLGMLGQYGLLLSLLCLIALFSALTPLFFRTATFQAIIATQAVLLILALAVTVPLRAGDFDISVGQVLGFGMALVTVLAVNENLPWAVAAISTILAAVAIGIINGVLVIVLRVDAFIATLGTGTVTGGLTLAITGGATIAGVPASLQTAVQYDIFGLPAFAFYGFALAITLWYIYEYTPLGRKLLVVGEGREPARLAGIAVGRIRFGAFVASAGISGLAGVLYAGQLGSEDPSVGPSFLLAAYAAAFLGATTIKLGRFNALGTVVALYFLATGITGMELLGAPFWIEPIFNGAALTVAVTVAGLAARRRMA
jgi:ribose transport system permease protein